ncbi:putative origin recognition complex subunit orc5 protein [Diplogelasinospora grovesii]|uniref:Origin recognition complex subunit orc5 protein n=1 Tax=Diplogelasinospora grovesii TaxID=303347 RepID=A0AAN6NK27_9PEZI|nr:putative origin recognition complex subunit orc5 protein [Diplogelasinospora grovesii]
MNKTLFQLPDELLLTTLAQSFPCRDAQIRALATLLAPTAAPARNLVLYGTEATGKTAITTALLHKLSQQTTSPEDDGSLRYAVVNSTECITARHLFESAVGKSADALQWPGAPSRCESLSQLTVELSKMLKYPPRPDRFRFVLVFDGIDRQRETPPTLLPALARLPELIPCLTTVFIVTSPPANFLRTSFVPSIHFPNYSRSEFITILSTTIITSPATPLPKSEPLELADLWARFVGAVHDSLARAACRTLPSLRHACMALWPRFIAPITAGTHTAREFTKLLVLARAHFQDESLLDPGIIITTPANANHTPLYGGVLLTTAPKTQTPAVASGPDLAALLPTTARLLLLAAYLASHNATRHDLVLFSTHHHGRRRRRGGLSVGVGRNNNRRGNNNKHRKIARKLLGAHAFVLERMMAIFAAVRSEWDPKANVTEDMDADVGMAIATLASLRLLVRVGGVAAGGDPMDRGGKWRVNVGWEAIRGLGRSMGVEVEEWLID